MNGQFTNKGTASMVCELPLIRKHYNGKAKTIFAEACQWIKFNVLSVVMSVAMSAGL